MGDYDVIRKQSASALRSSLGHTTACVVIPVIQGLRDLSQCNSDILLALDKTRISPSSVWLCHSKFTRMERYRLLTVVIIA